MSMIHSVSIFLDGYNDNNKLQPTAEVSRNRGTETWSLTIAQTKNRLQSDDQQDLILNPFKIIALNFMKASWAIEERFLQMWVFSFDQ